MIAFQKNTTRLLHLILINISCQSRKMSSFKIYKENVFMLQNKFNSTTIRKINTTEKHQEKNETLKKKAKSIKFKVLIKKSIYLKIHLM